MAVNSSPVALVEHSDRSRNDPKCLFIAHIHVDSTCSRDSR